jgi:parallel beta-helix repeat protein
LIKSYLLTLIIIILLNFNSSATIINIPADYPTIQQGIDASTDGDTVLVEPSVYIELLDFNGHNITVGSLFLTTGDSSFINTTAIDALTIGRVVTFSSGEDSTAVITGFTIQNGAALIGAGIYCENNSHPVILGNKITQNNAIENGGGIYCFRSNPTIIGNEIRENTAGGSYSLGGGIYCNESNSEISNNNIIENYGSGITCENSSPIISNNTIAGNSGSGIICKSGSHANIINNFVSQNTAIGNNSYGGGICCLGSSPTIRNNTICENFAGEDGGGIFIHQNCIPLIIFNLIYENTAGTHGGGIHCGMGSSATIRNNTICGNSASYGGGLLFSNTSPITANTILWNNYALLNGDQIYTYNILTAVSYCDVQGGWNGEGNIDCDPFFCYPGTGDFHFAENSCCVGAGENGDDIGALGIGCDPTGIFDENKVLQHNLSMIQNYPNPFNAQTSIRYMLPEPGNVKLTIYDLLGRQVETVLDEYRRAGVHTVTFDASRLSSGVYFCRLRAGDVVESKRMVLLK